MLNELRVCILLLTRGDKHFAPPVICSGHRHPWLDWIEHDEQKRVVVNRCRRVVGRAGVVDADLVTGREIFATPLPAMYLNPARVWESLGAVSLSPETLTGNSLFPAASDHPAAVAFDILRTRLLHGLAEKGWKRIAVTSPTHGCGKSFVAANLALSLAQRAAVLEEGRIVATGDPHELMQQPELRRAYLGLEGEAHAA